VSAAEARKVPTITKLTYDAARKALIAAGWQPLRTKLKTDLDISEGNGPDFWQRGYVEVEACAGTGLAQCAFLFKDSYSNRLRVTTAGEELPREKAHAMVTGSTALCATSFAESIYSGAYTTMQRTVGAYQFRRCERICSRRLPLIV
jgi:hypothetical protein